MSYDPSELTGMSGNAVDVLREIESQLQIVENRCEKMKSRLITLRERLTSDGQAVLERTMTADPSLEERAGAIRTENLNDLYRELSEIVTEAPEEVPDEEIVDQLDDATTRMTDHHDQLMAAINRLSSQLDSESFSDEEAREVIDEGVRRIERITSSTERLQQLIGEIAPRRDEGADDEYVVAGTIRHGEEPLVGATVRAFDIDLASEESLGESTTDGDGRYEIRYTASQFARSERGFADVIVRVFNEVDDQLAESEIEHNVGHEVTINLRVPPEETIAPSEYARLQSELHPLLTGQSIDTISDEQIEFLTQELDLSNRDAYPTNERTLHLLRTATELAARTPFDRRVLYALARKTDGLDKTYLAKSDSSRLAEQVAAAVEEHIVDISAEGLEERLTRNIEDLRRAKGLENNEEVRTTIEIVTADEKPLVGAAVQVQDPNDERKQRIFETDENGTIIVPYLRSPDSDSDPRQLRVTVFNNVGAVLNRETLAVEGDKEVKMTVPDSGAGFAGGTTLGSLGENPSLPVPELSGLKDVSLAAVRRAGSVKRLAETVDLEPDQREAIDGLAALDLATDLQTAGALVERGFTDQFAIARTPFAEFSAAVNDALDPEVVSRVHLTARAQTAMIDVAMTEERTARRNRIAGEAAPPSREEVIDDGE